MCTLDRTRDRLVDQRRNHRLGCDRRNSRRWGHDYDRDRVRIGRIVRILLATQKMRGEQSVPIRYSNQVR